MAGDTGLHPKVLRPCAVTAVATARGTPPRARTAPAWARAPARRGGSSPPIRSTRGTPAVRGRRPARPSPPGVARTGDQATVDAELERHRLEQQLRMPLHTHREGAVARLDRLHHSVGS